MTLNISNVKENGYSVEEAKDLLGASYSELKNEGGYTIEDFSNAGVEYSQARTAFTAEELKDNELYATNANQEIAKKALDDAWNAWNYKNIDSQTAFEQAKSKAEEVGIDTSGYDAEAKRLAQQKAEDDAAAAERRRIQEANAAKERQNKINTYNNYLAARKKAKSITSSQINTLFKYGSAIGYGKKKVLSDIMGGAGADPFTWGNTMKAVLDASGINRWNLIKTYGDTSAASKAVQAYFKKTLRELKAQSGWKTAKAFETGGLANYTGPAWLDGTPSKPELVLNAADTQNFLALKDVLSKAVHSSNSISTTYGNATYEINVNVDHINSDYDVDRMTERIKKDIIKSAGYRNVTQVRNLR